MGTRPCARPKARAQRTLARFPSERAYLELVYQGADRLRESESMLRPQDQLIMGAATVASLVLYNPRIAACTQRVLE